MDQSPIPTAPQMCPDIENPPSTSSASVSSFTSQLQSTLKGRLKPTKTKFTSLDGSIQVLKNQGSSISLETEDVLTNSSKTYGFVVDTKPDKNVGQVRPWLFVSSQDVPNDVTLISSLKITHILSLLPGFSLHPSVLAVLKAHVCLEIYDEVDFNLNSPLISTALDFIENCRKSNGKVLLHCNAGVSRAPSLAILYLIKFENLSFDEAWKIVKSARPCSKPNDGFLKQIKLMNSIRTS